MHERATGANVTPQHNAREAAIPTATLSRESRQGRMPAGAGANPKQSIDGVHIIVSTSVVVTGRSHDDSWVTEL